MGDRVNESGKPRPPLSETLRLALSRVEFVKPLFRFRFFSLIVVLLDSIVLIFFFSYSKISSNCNSSFPQLK